MSLKYKARSVDTLKLYETQEQILRAYSAFKPDGVLRRGTISDATLDLLRTNLRDLRVISKVWLPEVVMNRLGMEIPTVYDSAKSPDNSRAVLKVLAKLASKARSSTEVQKELGVKPEYTLERDQVLESLDDKYTKNTTSFLPYNEPGALDKVDNDVKAAKSRENFSGEVKAIMKHAGVNSIEELGNMFGKAEADAIQEEVDIDNNQKRLQGKAELKTNAGLTGASVKEKVDKGEQESRGKAREEFLSKMKMLEDNRINKGLEQDPDEIYGELYDIIKDDLMKQGTIQGMREVLLDEQAAKIELDSNIVDAAAQLDAGNDEEIDIIRPLVGNKPVKVTGEDLAQLAGARKDPNTAKDYVVKVQGPGSNEPIPSDLTRPVTGTGNFINTASLPPGFQKKEDPAPRFVPYTESISSESIISGATSAGYMASASSSEGGGGSVYVASVTTDGSMVRGSGGSVYDPSVTTDGSLASGSVGPRPSVLSDYSLGSVGSGAIPGTRSIGAIPGSVGPRGDSVAVSDAAGPIPGVVGGLDVGDMSSVGGGSFGGSTVPGSVAVNPDGSPAQDSTSPYEQLNTTIPIYFNAKYHKVPYLLFYGTIYAPNIDKTLYRSMLAVDHTNDVSVLSQMCDSIIKEHGNDIFVYKRATGPGSSKEDVLQEAQELVQLQFCILRNLSTGDRVPMGKVPLSQLAKLGQAANPMGAAPGPVDPFVEAGGEAAVPVDPAGVPTKVDSDTAFGNAVAAAGGIVDNRAIKESILKNIDSSTVARASLSYNDMASLMRKAASQKVNFVPEYSRLLDQPELVRYSFKTRDD